MASRRCKPRAPAVQSNGIGGWFSNQLWNTSLPWLAIVAFGMTGFYFLTNARLDRLEVSQAEQKVLAAETRRQDSEERGKARDEFIRDSKATAIGIAELNKQTAVMATTLQGVEKSLEKIGQKLEGRR